jgi:hypothetical protein
MQIPYTEQQRGYILAYAIARAWLQGAGELNRAVRQLHLDAQVSDLQQVGVTLEEADAYLASRQFFTCDCRLVDLGSEEAPSSLHLQAYCALCHASQRIGEQNYRQGLYGNGKFKAGRPLAYRITAEHQAVVEAMRALQAGLLTPEGAMALLHDPAVMQQRLGR